MRPWQHTCSKKNESKGFLEWYVVEQTLNHVLQPERIDFIADRIVEEYNKEFSIEKIRTLERRVKSLEAEIEKTIDLALAAPTEKTKARFIARSEQLDAEQTDLQIDIAKLKVAANIRYKKEEIVEWLKIFCEGDPLDPDFAKKIIDVFVNSVYVYDDKIVVYYNVKDSVQISYIEPLEEADEDSQANDAAPESSKTALSAPPKRRSYRSKDLQLLLFIFTYLSQSQLIILLIVFGTRGTTPRLST